jgi:predicted ATPase
MLLDNFEHLLEAAPEVAELIEGCPELCVLATSRAPLRVRAEQEYPVAPLEVPDPGRVQDLQGVGGAPAVELFVERARRASPAFELTRHNAASVAAICRRLGGLPLALELAAAQSRVMGPAALLSRLDRALEAGGARDLPERQRTMRATLDWSYDLLREPEKELFTRLSVFAGGFTLEAAEAVGADGEAADEDHVLVLLKNLVEQSLILAQPEEGGEEMRYGMLEPVRHYAREKLQRGAGTDEEARRRHAEYYLALAEEAGPKLRGHEQTIWLPRLEGELDNLRAALTWCVGHGEGQRVARMAWASWTYWGLSGRMSEGRRWMEAALESEPGMPDASRARLLHIAATLGAALGDFGSARPANEESIRLFRRLGGDEGGVHLATGTAGLIAAGQGRPEEGLPMMVESAERRLEAGDKWASSVWFGFAATVALGLGDGARARRLAERSLSLGREVGAREAVSLALRTLATIARSEDDLELAGSLFGEGLRLNYEIGERTNIAYFLEGLAEVSAAEGRLERAARLWGAARTLPDTVEVVAYPHAADRAFYERLTAARERLDRQRAWEEAWAEGRAMSTEEAVAYALEDHKTSLT